MVWLEAVPGPLLLHLTARVGSLRVWSGEVGCAGEVECVSEVCCWEMYGTRVCEVECVGGVYGVLWDVMVRWSMLVECCGM